MIQRIITLPKATRRRHDLSSLRIVLARGSAMTPRVPCRRDGSREAVWVAVVGRDDMGADPRTL
jgi:hypothetical protein